MPAKPCATDCIGCAVFVNVFLRLVFDKAKCVALRSPARRVRSHEPNMAAQAIARRPVKRTLLRIDAAELQHEGHTIYRQHIGGRTIIYAVHFRVTHNLVKTVLHDVLQALVDLALTPE